MERGRGDGRLANYGVPLTLSLMHTSASNEFLKPCDKILHALSLLLEIAEQKCELCEKATAFLIIMEDPVVLCSSTVACKHSAISKNRN